MAAGTSSENLMSNVRPLGDRVLVKREEAVKQTAGGLVLPDTAKEERKECRVLAVGPGRKLSNGTREEMNVAVGDLVLVSQYAGTNVKLDGADVILVSESDILAVLE